MSESMPEYPDIVSVEDIDGASKLTLEAVKGEEPTVVISLEDDHSGESIEMTQNIKTARRIRDWYDRMIKAYESE